MNKDINKTMSMLVPVLNQTGERIESIAEIRRNEQDAGGLIWN